MLSSSIPEAFFSSLASFSMLIPSALDKRVCVLSLLICNVFFLFIVCSSFVSNLRRLTFAIYVAIVVYVRLVWHGSRCHLCTIFALLLIAATFH